MRALEDAPTPYATHLTPAAAEQLGKLPREAQQRARANLLQLADLAAFAAGYSLPVKNMSSLIADAGGVSIRYRVDDGDRAITVLEFELL